MQISSVFSFATTSNFQQHVKDFGTCIHKDRRLTVLAILGATLTCFKTFYAKMPLKWLFRLGLWKCHKNLIWSSSDSKIHVDLRLYGPGISKAQLLMHTSPPSFPWKSQHGRKQRNALGSDAMNLADFATNVQYHCFFLTWNLCDFTVVQVFKVFNGIRNRNFWVFIHIHQQAT